MEKIMWLVSFKVRILRSSPLAMDDSEYADAEAVTYGKSETEARTELLQELESAKLELIEIYHNSAFNNAAWVSNSEHKEDILQLVEEVKYLGEFRFGIFRDPEEKVE